LAVASALSEQSSISLASATGPSYAVGGILVIAVIVVQLVPGAITDWQRVLFADEPSGYAFIVTFIFLPVLLWGMVKLYRQAIANDELQVDEGTFTLIQRTWPLVRTRRFKAEDIDYVAWQSEKIDRNEEAEPILRKLSRFSGLRGYIALSHQGRMVRLVTDPSVELAEELFKVFRSAGVQKK
jgi:hypothetical protein